MGAFEDREVVVTGGRGALGFAVVSFFEKEGARVHVPTVDLSVEDEVAGFYASLPGLWASVHLAGGFAAAPIGHTRLDDWRAMHDKNAVTCFLCCREALMLMRRTGEGRIVNVAARPAVAPAGGMIA